MGRSTEYYRNNPKAREKKKAYDTAFGSTDKQKTKRAELNKANRKAQKNGTAKVGDGKDFSHTKKGLVQKPQSQNRGSKSDTKGDKSARGKKK